MSPQPQPGDQSIYNNATISWRSDDGLEVVLELFIVSVPTARFLTSPLSPNRQHCAWLTPRRINLALESQES